MPEGMQTTCWRVLSAIPAAKNHAKPMLRAFHCAIVGFALACSLGVSSAQAGTRNPELIDSEVNSAAQTLIDEAIAAPKNNQSCTIMVGSNGELAASVMMNQLSSQIMGGRPGTATLETTNGSYSLHYDLPATFSSMPSGNTAAIRFTGSYSGNGVTNFLNLAAGNQIKLKRGTTNVLVDLNAEISTGTFATGHYSAEAVLRCE